MNKTILISLVFIFALSFGLTYSVNAADINEEWKCGSGLTCGSSCQGVSYKPIGGTNDPEFTFSAEAGMYNCDLSIKNTWFAFTGDTPELNEYSDVYINDVKVGNTDDLFCNAVGPAYCGDGDCEKDAGGNILETDCPQDCCSHIGNENDCITFANNVYYDGDGGQIHGCYWYPYSWYGNSGGVCRAGGGFDLSPPMREGMGGCKNNDVNAYLQNHGYDINRCSCYIHGRWNGYCAPYKDVKNTIPKEFPPYSYDYDENNDVCTAKSQKYCQDATYFEEDCISGSVAQAIGAPGSCEFGYDHVVLSELGSGITCNDVLNNDYYRLLLIFLHYEHPDDPNYICCFGHNLDDGMHCVINEECKGGQCIGNVCGGGANQAPDPPTIVNSKTTCPVNAEGSDRCGFSVSADDPDGDQVRYHFDWGDGETTHTVWVDSGQARWKRHTYTSAGAYTVKIKTEDANGAFSSEVSDSVIVTSGGVETHWKCVGFERCEEVSGPGEDQCTVDTQEEDCGAPVYAGESDIETDNIHFSFEFVYIILILILGLLFIRKNLTYLYELFKMNAGKVTLVLMMAFVLMFFIHFSSAEAADINEEWKCGSGLTCGSSCQGVSYKPIGGTNDPEFTFSAEAGMYNCDLSIKNTWFAFTGDTPELNEYSDVYLNDVRIGNTDDLFCNSVMPNGNGNGPVGGECRDGELDVIGKEIYTRAPIENPSDPCGLHYGYCSTSPGIPRGCCACREFTVQSHYLEDGKWARIRVSGGARCCHGSCCKNKAGKIFLSEEPCSAPGNSVCQMPSSTICSVQGHRGASTCCDLSGYVGQTIHACACNTERAYGCDNPGEGQHPVAIAVCGYGTNMETCSDGNGDCVVNGDCESGETHANCPEDCECDTVADCPEGAIACTNHECIYPTGTHKECVGKTCKPVPGAGSDECDTDDDCEGPLPVTVGVEMLIIMILVGLLAILWRFIIRKNLTYLYELFKMNAGKVTLVLMIAFVLMFFIHFSSAEAADINEEWKCGSGLTCGSSCQGVSYKPIGGTNDPEFTFSAEAGIYNCDLSIKNTWFAFTGDTPELNEYSDVYINDVNIGHTDDLFCNSVPPPNGPPPNGGPCEDYCDTYCVTDEDCNGGQCIDNECKCGVGASGVDGANVGYCDDAALRIYDGESIELDMSMCKRDAGAYAFIKSGGNRPRCQDWDFSGDPYNPLGDIGGTIIEKYTGEDCDGTVTVNLGPGSYTIGTWAQSATGSWSKLKWCKVPSGDGGCTSHAECGSGKVCCDETCYTGDCCDGGDCSFDEICHNHFCITSGNGNGNGPEPPDNGNGPIPYAGESEIETENIHFSLEFVYIILILMVGFLVAWKLLIRKNLTYLYELFKMNAGKMVLVLLIAFVLSFSVHFSFANAVDINEEWKCGSGLTCGSSCQGNPYKSIGGTNDPEFPFPAEAGIYNCDLSIKNTWFAFTGDTPELNEYSDVYINDVKVGHTDDLFCNSVTGNDENPCKLGLSPAECEAIPECDYQYYAWYNVSTRGRCAGVNCAPYPHSCTAPSAWHNYAYSYFPLMEEMCCSCWNHGAWCGSCVESRPESSTCRVKSPKYCTDIHYSERYCEQVIPGSGVQCEWDYSHSVMVDETQGRDPAHTNGIKCEEIAPDEALPEYEKYKSVIGIHHFGTDESNTDYICCFAKSGTLSEGQHCVRNEECKSPHKCLVAGTTTECENSNNANRVCTCGGTGNVTNQAPDPPTIVNSKTTCPVNAEGSDRCGFSVSADDPDGDQVRYHFDWGDGETTHTVWVDSGEARWKRHTYTSAGAYTVKIKTEDANGAFSSEVPDSVIVTSGGVETHWKCVGFERCEEVSGPGEDECTVDTQEEDCGAPVYAGETEMETESVYFGLTFNGFNGNGKEESGDEGTTLSFASGCEYCGDVIKTIPVTGVELKATGNKIKLDAYQSHGLRSVSITCTKLEPPVADAGPDQTVNLTGPYVTVYFNGLGSYDHDGYIVDYRWNFSDGYFSGNNPTPSHNYYDEGIYNVTLNVTDNHGLKDSDYMILTVGDTPTITDDYAYDGVWVNSDQVVTLTAQDSSGIDRVMYCYGVDCDPAGGWVLDPPYTLSFAQDMDRWARYKAWDIYDNPSETGEFRVMIDKTAPVTTDDSDTELHGNNYAVTLTCTDGDGSGCDNTYYCVSPNGSSTCNPINIGTTVYVTCGSFDYCEKVIQYYSTDGVGNTELTKTSNTIRIDTRIPTCEMDALNPYTTTMSIGLSWSGEDPGGSGVTGYRIHYKEGSGSWDVWNDFSSSVESGTFTNVDEGKSYYFRCQAKSIIYPNGGSYSSTVSTFVDTTPPDASMDELPEWANQDSFLVSWSGSDPGGSGLKDYDIQYSTSPPSWTSWLSDTELTSDDFGDGNPINVNDGTTYHFRVRASDNAGLQGAWSSSESIGVDLTPPTCSVDDLPGYMNTSQVTVSWSGDDSGSGVKDYDVDYSTDDENWVSFVSQTTDESKTETLMDSDYYFRCRARDVADNVGDWSESEGVSVDTRAPGADVDYDSPVLVGKNITVNATLYDVSNITNVTLQYGDILISEVERIETYGNRWNVFWMFPVSDEYGPDEFYVITEDIHGNSKSERYSFNTVLCEEGEVRECGTDVGECIKGNQTCIEGIWGECLGGLSKRLEVCDNKDNDCNGLVDDGIQCSCVPGTTRDCGTDTGECQVGTQSCTSDQIWGPCGGNYVGPVPEVCDGKDNDCDGQIDNGANCCPEGKKRPCGFSNEGICKLGQSQCLGGVWGSCIGSVMPEQYDVCDNGLDDDCDGEVDEGCALCSNNEQDENEEGVDCGGPCPPCPEFPWFTLSIIGIIILIILFFLWKKLKEKGEELTWKNLKKTWTPA